MLARLYCTNEYQVCPGKNILKDIIQNYWNLLGRSITMITTKDLHRRKRYTRPKNLKDHLVRARTIFKEETTPPSLEKKNEGQKYP